MLMKLQAVLVLAASTDEGRLGTARRDADFVGKLATQVADGSGDDL
jgi:hypothetical protein